MSVTLVLVLFGVLCAIVAIITGLLASPNARVWAWADPVYYPIAIVGVVFLFISAERTRSLDALRGDVKRAEEQIAVHENAKPSFNARNFQPVFLETSYRLLISEMELGDACAKIPDTRPTCITAKAHARIIHELFDGFKLPARPVEDTDTAGVIKDYCERGYRLIDALQSAPLVGRFVYASLKTAFADLAKKNLSPMDWDGTEQARKAFDAAEDKEARYLLNVSPGNKEIDLQEWYDSERKFASNVFYSLSMCVRIPGADRDNLARFQQWSTEAAKAKEGLRTLQTNLETFQKSPPELSTSAKAIRFILDNIWSFILVTALSLKFARGIAGLRK